MTRIDGYAPIGDYGAVGDGRTVALVARDGRVDWLAVPSLDGKSVFGALLDAGKGGYFALAPVDDFEVERRYLPQTNVLETTFETAGGVATVTDSLNLQDGGQLSWIELARAVRGRRGRVRLRYVVRPRFDFGLRETTIERNRDAIVARDAGHLLAFRCWDAGEPSFSRDEIAGELETRRGSKGLLVCTLQERGPIALPSRDEIVIRFERSGEAWKRWVRFHRYEGDWEEAVERSLLALKLLIHAPSGAIAAAATTSLPERIGGELNWDYRYAWVRDSSFTLDALGSLGFREQVHASLSWLLRAIASTNPRLQPFYTLDGRVARGESELALDGYRGSRPVRSGNHASQQLQLGSYGDLLETIQLYVGHGNTLDEKTAVRVADAADHLCRIWRNDDSGIWELQRLRPYTSSKVSSWVALDRALRLASEGQLPDDRVDVWRRELEQIVEFVDARCWSNARQSLVFHAGSEDLDAATLLAVRVGYLRPDDPRATTTIDAIRDGLGAGGPLLYRYSGCAPREGAFLACSFWLVEALARTGRPDEARQTMDELLELSNDVGLYSEQLDPATRELLGNFPQGLTHLALINAAAAIAEAERERSESDEQA